MLSIHDHQRLTGVMPLIVSAVDKVFDDMAGQGTPMFVCQGVRTTEYQHNLFMMGRPGGPVGSKVVTNKDGYRLKSDHQVYSDGYGHAVDCAFLPIPARKDPWDPKWPWEAFGVAAEKHGLRWGGRWKNPVDLDHVELV